MISVVAQATFERYVNVQPLFEYLNFIIPAIQTEICAAFEPMNMHAEEYIFQQNCRTEAPSFSPVLCCGAGT